MIKVQKCRVPRQGHPLVHHSSVPIRALTQQPPSRIWHLVWRKTSEQKNPVRKIGEKKSTTLRSTLPMMITEYGADAYDNTNQREWQNDEQNLGLGHG